MKKLAGLLKVCVTVITLALMAAIGALVAIPAGADAQQFYSNGTLIPEASPAGFVEYGVLTFHIKTVEANGTEVETKMLSPCRYEALGNVGNSGGVGYLTTQQFSADCERPTVEEACSNSKGDKRPAYWLSMEAQPTIREVRPTETHLTGPQTVPFTAKLTGENGQGYGMLSGMSIYANVENAYCGGEVELVSPPENPAAVSAGFDNNEVARSKSDHFSYVIFSEAGKQLRMLEYGKRNISITGDLFFHGFGGDGEGQPSTITER